MKMPVILVCLSVLLSSIALAQPSDVPPDHWAYEAVIDLANKGYVLGYPDGKFIGNRTLTRYEFATIVKRILDNLENRISSLEGEVSSYVPKDTSTAGADVEPALPGVSKEDLEKIDRLVEEFKVELTVIGTRLDKVESEIERIKAEVENINVTLTDEEGPVVSMRNDVSKLKKISWSGYLQTRYEVFPDKLDEDGKVAKESFFVRRARLKITAKPSSKSSVVVSFDAGQNKFSAKDVYLEYAFMGDPSIGPAIDFGQQNWPFGYEISYSSGKRETPERALFVRRFFPGERDRGIKFMFPLKGNWLLQLGAFDGTGTESLNTIKTVVTDSSTIPPKTEKITTGSTINRDLDNKKDIIANLQYVGNNLEFGLSGYWGKGIFDPDRTQLIDTDKIRYGVDFRYFTNRLTFKGEYMRAKGVDQAKDFDLNKWVDGYYTQLNYNLSQADTLVVRYETLSEDPRNVKFGRRSSWQYGWLRWLDDRSRLKLFFQSNKEEQNAIDNDIWRMEWLVSF
jgi:hypothetical protein